MLSVGSGAGHMSRSPHLPPACPPPGIGAGAGKTARAMPTEVFQALGGCWGQTEGLRCAQDCF